MTPTEPTTPEWADVRTVEPLALRAKDAARLLSISTRALWSLTNRGEVPHVRIGKSVLYPTDALRAWLAQQTKGGAR